MFESLISLPTLSPSWPHSLRTFAASRENLYRLADTGAGTILGGQKEDLTRRHEVAKKLKGIV
jgi:hypothetical protein